MQAVSFSPWESLCLLLLEETCVQAKRSSKGSRVPACLIPTVNNDVRLFHDNHHPPCKKILVPYPVYVTFFYRNNI